MCSQQGVELIQSCVDEHADLTSLDCGRYAELNSCFELAWEYASCDGCELLQDDEAGQNILAGLDELYGAMGCGFELCDGVADRSSGSATPFEPEIECDGDGTQHVNACIEAHETSGGSTCACKGERERGLERARARQGKSE